MTEHDILDAIGDMDPAYLEEATEKPFVNKRKWIRPVALAACLLIVVMIPLAYRQYIWMYNNLDYASEAYEDCRVYYVKDQALYYESVGIYGGDAEMFEAWRDKNGIRVNAALQGLTVLPKQEDSEEGCTVRVTLSASVKSLFEEADGERLREALKRTIASYREITVDKLELIFV